MCVLNLSRTTALPWKALSSQVPGKMLVVIPSLQPSSDCMCLSMQVPVDRALTFQVASNLYRDAEELLRNLHLAPFSKPLVSLIDDFPVQQKHKGWQIGYLTGNFSSQVLVNLFKLCGVDALVQQGHWDHLLCMGCGRSDLSTAVAALGRVQLSCCENEAGMLWV